MSSISTGIDPAAKYQRLSAEYVKVRNQVSVLKSALLEEQAKTTELQRQITAGDTKLRKAESERDSLAFRNDQLVKRVESLQESLEAQLSIFEPTKGKKKHKEANLRLVAENTRMHQHQTFGGTSTSDPNIIMEEELERKILENSVLHSKLFDVERRSTETTNELLQRIESLQKENSALRNASSLNGSTNFVKTANTDLPTNSLSNIKGNATITSPDCGGCSNLGEQLSNSEMDIHSRSRSSDGKPSDSAVSVDSTDQTDVENEEIVAKRRLLEEYYTERISTLTKSLQHATDERHITNKRSFQCYILHKCEELVRKGLSDAGQIEDLQSKVRDLEDKCTLLHETLETTQQNYGEQMKQLHEYMAEQDDKMNSSTQDDQHLYQAVTRNGVGSKKREKRPMSWFSSS
uniref:Protein phosphatase 1 regulatory subunit 21 N-terminal domain-containing protein n=1 Tax=Meloidogyne javanica TaxID=6303 RepID=A0A915N745_MELJA